jgi:hypothetical protein
VIWPRRRQASTPQPPVPEPASDVPVFLDQARWLVDHHWRRSDGFERKAVAILGFVGVVIVLIPQGLEPVAKLTGRAHAVAVALGCATVTFLIVSAAAAVAALWTRKGASVSIADTRGLWLDRRRGQMATEADVTFTEWLLDADALSAHRNAIAAGDLTQPLVTSPVQALSDEAQSRGLWFTVSATSLALALLLLSLISCQLLLATR